MHTKTNGLLHANWTYLHWAYCFTNIFRESSRNLTARRSPVRARQCYRDISCNSMKRFQMMFLRLLKKCFWRIRKKGQLHRKCLKTCVLSVQRKIFLFLRTTMRRCSFCVLIFQTKAPQRLQARTTHFCSMCGCVISGTRDICEFCEEKQLRNISSTNNESPFFHAGRPVNGHEVSKKGGKREDEMHKRRAGKTGRKQIL